MDKTAYNQAASPKPSTSSDCASRILLLGIWLWVVLIPFGFIFSEIFIFGSILLIPHYYIWITSILQALLLLPILIIPALFWKNPRHQSVFQTWALAATCGLFLLPAHIPQPYAAQSQAILHVLGLSLYLVILFLIGRKQKQGEIQTQGKAGIGRGISLALLCGGIYFYPWLAWGALGSLLDTILQLWVGILFGLASSLTLNLYFLPRLHTSSKGKVLDFLLGGFTIGTTLYIMSSSTGFGYSVMQALLMVSLPTLGWTIMGIIMLGNQAGSRRSLFPEIIMITLAIIAPILLIDADELALIISLASGEILGWAIKAALVSMGIGLLSGLIFLVFSFHRASRTTSPEVDQTQITHRRATAGLGIIAGITWAVGGLVYFMVGQPGFYGEGLFVILKDQADVSAAREMPDYMARRRFVYTTLVDHASTSQAEIRKVLDRWGIEYTPYYLENAIQVQGGPLLRLWLSSRPEVDRILSNPWMRPLPETPPVNKGKQTSPAEGILWNQSQIGADRVWDELGVTGQGITVGQSDSGVQWDHPELVASYRGSQPTNGNPHDYNWFDPWYRTEEPTDLVGHGTHSLGVVLGKHTGIAPGATWFACVNMARNLGNPSLYLDCMQFMLAPFPIGGDPFIDGDPTRGAHVINNSWGCPDHEGCDINALLYGIRALSDAGVFVVASAGNDGPFCKSLNMPPSAYADALAVGAIDQFGQLAYFSSIGPVTEDGSNRNKPDLIAPGVNIFSSMPEDTYGTNIGTSFSGPHVTGVVALMWSANPGLIGEIEHTWEILTDTTKPYQGTFPDCPGAEAYPSTATGYGILDAYQAVKMALQASTEQ